MRRRWLTGEEGRFHGAGGIVREINGGVETIAAATAWHGVLPKAGAIRDRLGKAGPAGESHPCLRRALPSRLIRWWS